MDATVTVAVPRGDTDFFTAQERSIPPVLPRRR